MHGGYLTKPQHYAAYNKSRRERYASDPEFRARRIIGRKKRTSEYQKRLRIRAMDVIAHDSMKCVRCGIEDMKILEINHINGDPNREGDNTGKFYRSIIRRNRPGGIEDLEILCKVCNIIHYVEMKFNICWNPVNYRWPKEKKIDT